MSLIVEIGDPVATPMSASVMPLWRRAAMTDFHSIGAHSTGFRRAKQRQSVTANRNNAAMTTIGERVRAAREAHGVSRAALAHDVGIAVSTLSDLELGRSHTTTALHRIATRLGLTAVELETGKPGRRGTLAPIPSPETSTDYVRVPQLDMPAGAGEGDDVEVEPEVVRWLDVAQEWADTHFSRNLTRIRVLTTRGDSMVGAGIKDGDLLFVDTGIHRYEGDGYYVLRFRNGWQVKRLRADVLSQRLEIVSMLAEREEAKPVSPAEEDELSIGGKVAAWWTLRQF